MTGRQGESWLARLALLVGIWSGIGWFGTAPVQAATRPERIPLALGFSQGIILRQHAVPIRLPLQVPFISPNTLLQVWAKARAPALTANLLHLSRYDPNSLQTTTSLPSSINDSGYFVMMGQPMPLAYGFPVVSRSQFGTTGIAIIGTFDRFVQLPRSNQTISLTRQVSASWYHGPRINGAFADSLLVWRQNGDSYAIWADNPTGIALSQIEPDMVAMARSMAREVPLHGIRRAAIHDRYFDNSHPTRHVAGYLVTQSLNLAPPGTLGYRVRDGVGWRLTRTISSVAAKPPPVYRRSVHDRFPGLESVVSSLRHTKIRVLLPTVTPYVGNLRDWPYLFDMVTAQGYLVSMQLTNGQVPPNTPETMDALGLSGVLGVVAGGNEVRQANLADRVPKRLTAPKATMAQFEKPGWVTHHLVNGFYRGYVTLSPQRSALVTSDAADGDTFVEFRLHDVPYGIDAYHSAVLAVQMAASMTQLG